MSSRRGSTQASSRRHQRRRRSMQVHPEMYQEQLKALRPDLTDQDLHNLARQVSDRVNAALGPIKRKHKEPLPQALDRLAAAKQQAEREALHWLPKDPEQVAQLAQRAMG